MAKRKSYSAEQIIMKLREADVLLAQGKIVKEIVRSLEISEQTFTDGGKNMADWIPHRPAR